MTTQQDLVSEVLSSNSMGLLEREVSCRLWWGDQGCSLFLTLPAESNARDCSGAVSPEAERTVTGPMVAIRWQVYFGVQAHNEDPLCCRGKRPKDYESEYQSSDIKDEPGTDGVGLTTHSYGYPRF